MQCVREVISSKDFNDCRLCSKVARETLRAVWIWLSRGDIELLGV